MMASVGAAGSRRVLTRLVGSRGFSTGKAASMRPVPFSSRCSVLTPVMDAPHRAPPENKAAIRRRLLAAKAASGATYDEIAEKTGLTNAYVAQLFHRQVKETVAPRRVEWQSEAHSVCLVRMRPLGPIETSRSTLSAIRTHGATCHACV